jgi:hypothetical protein
MELRRTRLRSRRVSATVEARRSWNVLTTREEFVRSHIGMLYRMLGRTDIMSDRWMRYGDGTPMSQRDVDEPSYRERERLGTVPNEEDSGDSVEE